MKQHSAGILLIPIAVALLVLIATPFLGLTTISPRQLFEDPAVLNLFLQIRVPRVLTGFLGGTGLAICGMAFQALFRNPLATPYTLGVASGASFGAASAIRFGVGISVLGVSSIAGFALLGALGSMLLVYGLARLGRGIQMTTLLMAGIAVSFFFSSMVVFLQYISDFTSSFRLVRWLMGGLEMATMNSVWSLLPAVASGFGVLWYMRHELNLLVAGPEVARSRGVDVARVQKLLFFVCSWVVAMVVVNSGPIGFVGIIVPHIARMVVGTDHRLLVPGTALLGGSFLVLCDTAARLVLAPAEIPVGVLTALVGGPFFLFLLIRNTRSEGRIEFW